LEDFDYKEEDLESIESNRIALEELQTARLNSEQGAIMRNTTVWEMQITINQRKSAPSYKAFKQSIHDALCDFSVDLISYNNWLRQRVVLPLEPK